MPGTTVYPAKVALKAIFENVNLPAGATAAVWPGTAPTFAWGEPTRSEDKAWDNVFFGDTTIEDSHRIIGAPRTDEEYRLRIVVDVYRHGTDEQATEKRGWDLHDAILVALNANRTLGGTISHLTNYTVRQVNPLAGPQQGRTQIVIDAGCAGFIFY